jgi:hypothetical protein
MVGSFTEIVNPVIYIPDTRSARVKRGCRQTRRIRNDMDESEFHPRIQRCSAYNQSGHTYKRCPNNDAMLALIVLKLALQVMLEMEDLRLHQGAGDVAD